jgi:hypothetical protein
MALRFERYGQRFWAVYDGAELICVTVYKRGAVAVIGRIEKTTDGRSAALSSRTPTIAPATLLATATERTGWPCES